MFERAICICTHQTTVLVNIATGVATSHVHYIWIANHCCQTRPKIWERFRCSNDTGEELACDGLVNFVDRRIRSTIYYTHFFEDTLTRIGHLRGLSLENFPRKLPCDNGYWISTVIYMLKIGNYRHYSIEMLCLRVVLSKPFVVIAYDHRHQGHSLVLLFLIGN